MLKKVAYLSIVNDNEPDSEPTLVDITSDTILGRSKKLHTYTGRDSLVDTSGIKTFVRLDAETVSRNHAVLRPSNGGKAQIWNISKNYTKLFGRKITHSELEPEDIIHIGPFTITYDERIVDPKYLSRQALLIGNPTKLRYLGGDVEKMYETLTNKGFQEEDITVLLDRQTKRGRVLKELEKAREQSGERGLFVLYYTGHFSEQGMLGLYSNPWELWNWFREWEMGPEELYQKLDGIKGNKIAIMDTCLAGRWKEAYHKYNPSNTLVVASTQANDYAHSGKFSVALSKALNQRNNFVDLKELKDEINYMMNRYTPDEDRKQFMTITGHTAAL